MASRLKDLRGKAVVDLRNGVKVGAFEDLLIAPNELGPKVIVTNRGSIFHRRVEGILIEDVRVWGKDVILVDNQDVVRTKDTWSEHKDWVMASDHLRGRYVVSIDGKRVGQADDFLLDDNGRITGLSLNQVFIKGPLAQMKEIPIGAVRSLGPDVIIIALDEAERRSTAAITETDLAPADTVPANPDLAHGSETTPVYPEPLGVAGSQPAYAGEEAGGARIYPDERNL